MLRPLDINPESVNPPSRIRLPTIPLNYRRNENTPLCCFDDDTFNEIENNFTIDHFNDNITCTTGSNTINNTQSPPPHQFNIYPNNMPILSSPSNYCCSPNYSHDCHDINQIKYSQYNQSNESNIESNFDQCTNDSFSFQDDYKYTTTNILHFDGGGYDNNPFELDLVDDILLDAIKRGVENEPIALIIAQITNSLMKSTNNITQTVEHLMKANIINILNKAIKIHSKSEEIQKECKLALININEKKNAHKNNGSALSAGYGGFKCKDCGKFYKHLCNLRSHSKIHTESAHVCEFCGKKFGRRSNYVEHRRVHTGERPFTCELCKKSFKQKHGWKNHVKLHKTKGLKKSDKKSDKK